MFSEFEALRVHWERTQSVWQDVVRQEFAQEHWQPLDTLVLNALSAMDLIAPVISQVRQECAGREFF